jgi:hypothetical protein
MTAGALPAGIVWNENALADAGPDLTDFSLHTDFICIATRRVILLALGGSRFYEAIKLKQDFIGVAALLHGHLVDGQLLIPINFVNAVRTAAGLEVSYD